jgi:hypothetical protein
LNAHGVKGVRRNEIHTAEPLPPEPSSFDAEIAIEKLKRYKLPGTDQIWQEVIHYVLRSTNLLILFGIRKN